MTPTGQWGRFRNSYSILVCQPAQPTQLAKSSGRRQMAKPGSPRSASNPPEELILDDQFEGHLVL